MTSLVTKIRPQASEVVSATVQSQAMYERFPSEADEWLATVQSTSGGAVGIVAKEPLQSVGAQTAALVTGTLITELRENVGLSTQAHEPRVAGKVGRLVKVEVSREARPLLAGELSRIQQILVPIIISKANECGMPLKNIYWSIKAHHEEKWRELVCSVFVEANCPQALAFWDTLGQAIAAWRTRETPLAQRLLDEQVAVFVEWE